MMKFCALHVRTVCVDCWDTGFRDPRVSSGFIYQECLNWGNAGGSSLALSFVIHNAHAPLEAPMR